MYTRKYTLYGALFGVAFPVIATLIEAATRHGGIRLESLLIAQRSPLMWIIGTAPLFLGLLARIAGREHDRVLAAERTRHETYLRAAADLTAAAEQLGKQADRIFGWSSQQTADASLQADALAHTTSSAAEVTHISAHTEEEALGMVGRTQRSEALSLAGQQAVGRAVTGIERLSAQVNELAGVASGLAEDAARIGEIVETVKDLADQSNILALNASIQASQAGEHGKGFSSVALEMRRLAEQSGVAAEQVKTILDGVLRRTRDTASAANENARSAAEAIATAREAASAIDGLASVVLDSAAAGRAIAAAARQEREEIGQIAAAMKEISRATSGLVENARGIGAAAGTLATLSHSLAQTVASYQDAASGRDPQAHRTGAADQPVPCDTRAP